MSTDLDKVIQDSRFNVVMQDAYSVALDHDGLLASAVKCMEIIATFGTMTGSQKKQCVLAILKQIINNHPFADPNTKTSMLFLLDTVIPPVIDLLVAAAQGMYNFIQQEKTKCGWFSCCCNNTVSSTSKK